MPKAKYPAIPEPALKLESLLETVLALKQAVEILTAQRGDASNAAATSSDLTLINQQILWIDGRLKAGGL